MNKPDFEKAAKEYARNHSSAPDKETPDWIINDFLAGCEYAYSIDKETIERLEKEKEELKQWDHAYQKVIEYKNKRIRELNKLIVNKLIEIAFIAGRSKQTWESFQSESIKANQPQDEQSELHNKIMVQWEKDFGSIHNEQPMDAYTVSGFIKKVLTPDN